MKKILMILSLVLSTFYGLWASSHLKEESQDKTNPANASVTPISSLEPETESWGNYLYNYGANKKAALLNNPAIEAKKFPHLKVSDIQELIKKHCTDNNSSWNSLIGKSYTYKTGSIENPTEYYDGLIFILSIDYGDEIFNYRGPQDGYDKPSLISKKNEITPAYFIDRWIKAKEDIFFFKGTPVHLIVTKNKISKWTIEYHVRRQNPNEYFIIKVYRTRIT
ncbi:MAG: hypothetical protein ACRYGR_07225 [Janthinobacterium lividum]